MSFSAYLKYAAWDFVLVVCASVALTYTLLNGFYIAPALQYSVIPAAVVVLLLAVLFGVGFNRRSMRVGLPVACVVILAGLMACAAMTQGSLVDDTEQNYLLFALICVLVSVLAYVLTRTRTGTAFLFIVGAFACSWIQFFYQRYELVWLLLFVLSALMLVIYKNYQLSARTATSVKQLSFSAGFGVAAAAALVAVGLGAGVWFGIIAPLNPGAVDIKLITEYRALETKQVQGTSSEYLTPNMSLTSDKTNSQSRTTDDLKQSESGTPMPAKPKGGKSAQEESSGSALGIDMSSLSKAFDFENNTEDAWRNLFLLLGVIAGIVALIVAYFLLRRFLRARRLARVQQLSPTEQVGELYNFIIKFIGKLGFEIPAGVTLTEFAANNASSLARFDAEAHESFENLTATYVGTMYGGYEASSEQARPFAAYYRSLWKAARKQLGNAKYFLRSFKL